MLPLFESIIDEMGIAFQVLRSFDCSKVREKLSECILHVVRRRIAATRWVFIFFGLTYCRITC